MAMHHHNLDVHPIPKGKTPLYINEPQLADPVLWEMEPDNCDPQAEADNVRFYVPIDLNRKMILRKLSLNYSPRSGVSD